MVRTQVYITEEEHSLLAQMAAETGKSQSQLVRDAIDGMFARPSIAKRQSILSKAKGMWQDRTDLPDFRQLRKEWDR